MRILLTSNASHVPPRGGSTRSNLAWLEYLAARGHVCRVVAPGPDELHERNGVTIRAIVDLSLHPELLREQVASFQPDWVLVSSEDVGHVLLRTACDAAPGCVVYLAHTPQFFPFGPQSWNRDARATELVRAAAAVVAIGPHMADYIFAAIGRQPVVLHPPIYGEGPFADCASFDRGAIAMINPSAVKGISIFLELASRFPQCEFAALQGWATTSDDRASLTALPNVTLLESCNDIEEFLRRTRVLLMPSLWYEGFGLIVMEAMLRGIPVIASDSGGLADAKLGTPFVIPVRPVEQYEPVFDQQKMPHPVVPAQDLAPWIDALGKLIADRSVYHAVSDASRQAALGFAAGVQGGQFEDFLMGLCPSERMKILFAQNSLYYPSFGGGDKSNRLLAEALAARGHDVRVVARIGKFGAEEHARFVDELKSRATPVLSDADGVVTFMRNAVEVHTATNHSNLRAYFAQQIAAFDPQVIVTSTDDPAQLLLEAALRAPSARVVYLVRTTLAVPFGPDSAFPSAAKTETLRRVDATVGVSRYVADYVRAHSGIDALALPISLLEPSPVALLDSFDNEFVTMVNPCAVKGIDIFLALARLFPQVRFAAVPTWGTGQTDRAALAAEPNVETLEAVDDIDAILVRTRVLLVPSLWAEARSRIVVEAMLRGVPVLASDIGGIPEAKLGVDYLLPVRPILKYRSALDEQMVPIAEVPPQDIAPWQAALTHVLSSRGHYEELSQASRAAAMAYADALSVRPFEELLQRVIAKPRSSQRTETKALSPERQRLLALRLRKPAPSPEWFSVPPDAGNKLRLFCFPHAGGGAAAFRDWARELTDIAVCPARLPGREHRLREAPFDRMEALVEALSTAIASHLQQPFAFFGHSMGAAVAFELARALRRKQLPEPACLLVSGARAPQFRLYHRPGPEPTDAELLEEVHRLGGLPQEVLDHQELLGLILPALRADARLYRNYAYIPESRLSMPMMAYGGRGDDNVKQTHLAAWREQTTTTFTLRMFEGGHFFLANNRMMFLQALTDDLRCVDWSLPAALEELLKAGRCESVDQLLREFLASTESHLAGLSAMGQGALKAAAHTLKGSCSQFGADAMAQTAARLHQSGERAEIEILSQQFARAKRAVERFLTTVI